MAFCQVKLWKEHVESVMTQTPVVEDPAKPIIDPTKRPPVKDANTANKPTAGLPKACDFWNTPVPMYWSQGEDKDKVAKHVETFKLDPLPFPADDPDPQCYYSFASSPDKPWHTQIHRDAFGYGQVPANIDQRRVVDLRWFGYTEESAGNYVSFSTDIHDEFGMPQVSIQILPSFRPELFCRAHGKSKTHDELTHLQPTFYFTEDTSKRQEDMRKE